MNFQDLKKADCVRKQDQAFPCGGPLSPLLGNIMLNKPDNELHKRGHKFVRYSDELVILGISKRAGERIIRNMIKFIEEQLFLKVNRDKTSVIF